MEALFSKWRVGIQQMVILSLRTMKGAVLDSGAVAVVRGVFLGNPATWIAFSLVRGVWLCFWVAIMCMFHPAFHGGSAYAADAAAAPNDCVVSLERLNL